MTRTFLVYRLSAGYNAEYPKHKIRCLAAVDIDKREQEISLVGLMIVIGIVLTGIVWRAFGPLAGLITAFLFIGGFGWKFMASIFGGLGMLLDPDKKNFINAWEERMGEMEFGESGTYPPPGLYQEWKRIKRSNGMSAGDFLDMLTPKTTDDLKRD